jgi:hypothetical protein
MLSLRLQIPKTATGVVLTLATLLSAACSDVPTSPTASATRDMQLQPNAALVSTASALSPYVSCPSTQAHSASKMIGPRGGIVGVAGSALLIPPGAVPTETRFTFIVPASDIMQIEAHADGFDHYVFQRPVVITIDYSRCANSVDKLASSFSAWYIDTPTRSALSWMGGVDDRRSHRLFFETGHLSGYAVSERGGRGSNDQ